MLCVTTIGRPGCGVLTAVRLGCCTCVLRLMLLACHSEHARARVNGGDVKAALGEGEGDLPGAGPEIHGISSTDDDVTTRALRIRRRSERMRDLFKRVAGAETVVVGALGGEGGGELSAPLGTAEAWLLTRGDPRDRPGGRRVAWLGG